MRKVNEIKGNLITLAREDKFDVIAHGCNCFCTMGAGIAPQMAKEFGADMFEKEEPRFRGDINKLGTIDYKHLYLEDTGRWTPYPDENGEWVEAEVTVVNAYTQFGFGRNHAGGTEAPLDYIALQMVMKKMNYLFRGKHIGLPWIGAGLAGGNWEVIKEVILRELKDCEVTLVEYDGSK